LPPPLKPRREHPIADADGPDEDEAPEDDDDVPDEDKNREEEDVDSGDDTFVPLKVLECLRKGTDAALENIDRMFRVLRACGIQPQTSATRWLQALADSVDSLEKCVRDGSRVYLARLERSVDARPYEMSAISTSCIFYSTLSAALNYLVEAAGRRTPRRDRVLGSLTDNTMAQTLHLLGWGRRLWVSVPHGKVLVLRRRGDGDLHEQLDRVINWAIAIGLCWGWVLS